MRRPVALLCFALLSSVLLAACGLIGSPRSLPPAPLLPPAELGAQLQISQRVTVTVEGQRNTFLGAWTVDAQRISFVGLSPSGQRLLTLSYDGEHFSEDYSPLLEEELPGRDVLSQLQLAHWPLESIERHLAEGPWQLQSGEGQRHLYFQERLVLSIHSQSASGYSYALPARIAIRSELAPYQLEVETLQVIAQ